MITQFLTFLTLFSLTPSVASEAMPGCLNECGNVTIPYPFGVGGQNCYHHKRLELQCLDSRRGSPPILYSEGLPVGDISLDGTMTINLGIAYACYDEYGNSSGYLQWGIWLSTYFTLSTRNMFTAIGCDTTAVMQDRNGSIFRSGCTSVCGGEEDVIDGSCSGIGCCQTTVPKGLRSLNVSLGRLYSHRHSWSYNPCSYAFLADSKQFNFNRSDLVHFTSRIPYINNENVYPAVFDWVVGTETCEEAKRNSTSYACRKNSDCVNSTNGPGYTCNCIEGYGGNPYTTNGCKDIDECLARSSPCGNISICTNTPGSYNCSCPQGYIDQEEIDGKDCIRLVKQTKLSILQLALGIGIAIMLLIILGVSFWLYGKLKNRRIHKLKQKFFIRNGGLLLEQQTSSGESNSEKSKIYFTKELEKATDNFNGNRVLGKGGSGTVYKGMLPDGRIVAIKKSKVVDETQISQFINELVILSEINHKHIVKVMGCCLETEVPLLVYEYVSRGTLSEHLHGENLISSISWEDRLRISREIAGALSYLHSSLSTPIFHRDIKSSNILLDENFKAKVSDFGISRSVPHEHTHLSTVVQGTFGYLDPEYFHSGQYTEKSDVYGFGVILVELLTGQKAVSFTRSEDEKNLAMHFIACVKEYRVLEILETRVANEARKEEIQVVASLAKKCLKLVSKKRPNMKEVLIQLENLRLFQHQQSLCLLSNE